MLLIGAGLLVRSFVRLEHSDAGFRAGNVLTGTLVLPLINTSGPAQIAAFESLRLWWSACRRCRG